MFDTIIRGGTVIDGQRTPRFQADIGIKDGRVASIGRIHNTDGARVIEAEGLIVAPGFVDLHTHYDSQVYWDPWCSISGWHGVTSVVIGNCGFGFAPVRREEQERAMLTMARNEAVPMESMREGMAWDWETYPEFLDSLERTPKGVNLLSYVGLNPLFAYVMGLEAAKSRPANEQERGEMARLFEEALRAGACGFSVQLSGEESVQRDYDGTPMITDRMAEEDLLLFAEVMGKVGRGFAQISGPFEAAEKVAAVSGRPVIWNLLAPATDQHGQDTPPHRLMIEKLEEANERGLRIFAQALTVDVGFEFNLEDWNLFDSSPVWREVTIGTREQRMAKMRDADQRQALRDEYDTGHGPIAGGGTEAQVRASGGGSERLRHRPTDRGRGGEPRTEGVRGAWVEGDRGAGRGAHHRRLPRPLAGRRPAGDVRDAAATDRPAGHGGGGELDGRHPGRLGRRRAHEVHHAGGLPDGVSGALGAGRGHHGPGAGALASGRLPRAGGWLPRSGKHP